MGIRCRYELDYCLDTYLIQDEIVDQLISDMVTQIGMANQVRLIAATNIFPYYSFTIIEGIKQQGAKWTNYRGVHVPYKKQRVVSNMRYRISDNVFSGINSESKSDIYRKFEFQFNNLFNVGEIAKSDTEFEKMYIADEEFEANIDNFLRTFNSCTQFCIGYTGIGKTTSIRHCFNLGVSNVPTLTTPSRLTMGKRMIVFPTFLDGHMQPTEDNFDLPNRILAVCSALENAHPELCDIYNSTDKLINFYEFIRNHTPHILEIPLDAWSQSKSDENDHIKRRLDYASKHYSFDYCACKLKYYISRQYDIYDRLVIILDDVETMPEGFQERIIMDYLHLFSAMQNTNYPLDSNFRINLLISLRPHTYRIFSNGIRGRMLSAYPVGDVILKSRSVDLMHLFKNRFDYYTSIAPKPVGNQESWRVSYEELLLINTAFDGKYKHMISNLCFMNVRKSLAEYAKIFANRMWIQSNRPKSDAFSVSSNEFTINNVTVIRAIGCGNSKSFTGENNSIIPNLFYTTQSIDYSIQCLLILQYFQRKMYFFTGGNVEYGLNAQELHKVYSELKYVLGEERLEQLKCAIQHLFKCKILRKSIIDFDDYQSLDTPESIEETSRLYLSPRGTELMEMFERDSILLEMLRECSWRDYSGRENDYSRECSFEIVRNGEQTKLFLDLLEYVDALRQAEEEFFFPQDGIKLQEYRNMFGSTLVVEKLFRGIENSLRISGKIYNSAILKKYNQVKQHILESTTVLLQGE